MIDCPKTLTYKSDSASIVKTKNTIVSYKYYGLSQLSALDTFLCRKTLMVQNYFKYCGCSYVTF
jgi:hypothetical protein